MKIITEEVKKKFLSVRKNKSHYKLSNLKSKINLVKNKKNRIKIKEALKMKIQNNKEKKDLEKLQFK
jgi:hypothetical protein